MKHPQAIQHDIFHQLSEAADTLELESYVIGGYVRDFFLGKECKDIDIVCVGSGIELATYFAKTYYPNETVHVFKNFGTAMLQVSGWQIEFVGARKESYNRDSRKPIVEDGTLQDDQNRRDFTINTLALCINAINYGELIDSFGGLEHLQQKILITPLDPDITFSDDPLRMMRCIRFASTLGFDIAPDTFEALKRNASRLEIISAERISDELNKIILSKTPSYGFKLLEASGLLIQFFPELCALKGVETMDGKGHKDNFYHTLQVLDNVSKVSDNLWLRWAAILHDIAKPATKRFDPNHGWTFHGHEERGARMVPKIFTRMRLPLDEKMKYVQKLVRLHLRPIALAKEIVTDSAIRRLLFEAGNDIDDLMKLCRADITSKNKEKVAKYISNFEKVEKRLIEVEQSDHIRNMKLAITGEIIMQTFGLKPSKEIGIIKDEILEAVLEGKIKNEFEAAKELMLEIGKKRNLTVHSS